MFYLTEIQTSNDGSTAVAPTATYTESVDATIAFHNKCAYNLNALKEKKLKAVLLHVMGTTGETIMKEYYTADNIAPAEGE